MAGFRQTERDVRSSTRFQRKPASQLAPCRLRRSRLLPVGFDKESESDFQLIAGISRDLCEAVAQGRFGNGIYARLNLWTFALPGLANGREDIAPNLDCELDRFAEREGTRVTFNKEAHECYLAFAMSSQAVWPGNFRDLAASVTRMATFNPEGPIDSDCVDAEVMRLKRLFLRDDRLEMPSCDVSQLNG